MSIVPSNLPPMDFRASSWIHHKLQGEIELADETIAAIADFTLMWTYFEGMACEENASVKKLATISTQCASGAYSSDQLYAVFRHFAARYFGAAHEAEFDDLHFRPGDRAPFVEEVLRAPLRSKPDAEVILALLIVVYRLRNNLFHGLKRVSTLNQQTPNFLAASRLLAWVLDHRDDTSGTDLT